MMWLYLIPTVINLVVLHRQFMIVVESPKGDPLIKTKVLFMIHTIANMSGVWLLLYYYRPEALIFFTLVSLIALYAYSSKS